MKISVKMVLLLVILTVTSGCAGNRVAMLTAANSTRQDVFQQSTESTATFDKALLKIDFPVKNYKARFINMYFKHSDPSYTVTVNIDGQSVVLTDEPVLEDLPGNFKENPEVGTGWKYNFRKELLLEPGKHHVTIAVPLSDVIIEKNVIFCAGKNQLQLHPVYKASLLNYPNYPRFSHGLRGIMVRLNAQIL